MSTLYEMTEDMKQLDEILTIGTDEKTEGYIKSLVSALENEIENKAENIIKVVKNKEAIVSSRKEEIKRLQELNKRDEKEIADLKQYTKECIERAGKKRVETVLGNLTVRKAQPVVKVIDATKLPADYLIQKTTINADKLKIKKHFNETGEILDGVEITLETSLTIPKAKKEKEEGEE